MILLEYLFLGWAFWVLLPLFALFSWLTLADTNEARVWPAFWSVLILGAVFYRYPAFMPHGWGWAWSALLYVAAGFSVSLTKWLWVLIDFRKLPVAEDIANAKAVADRKNPQNHSFARCGDAAHDLHYRDRYRHCSVETDGVTIMITPDWRKHPVANWLAYWPFFACSLILDPLSRLASRTVKALKRVYQTMAEQFTVKG